MTRRVPDGKRLQARAGAAPADRRKVYAVITGAGRAVVAAASRQQLRGIQREFGTHLSADDLVVVRSLLAGSASPDTTERTASKAALAAGANGAIDSHMDRFDFRGKTCLITGAASGIGRALALEFSGHRCALALVDRDAAGLADVAAAAAGRGAADVEAYVVDLADGGDRLDLAAQVLARHGGVDLLVNNAGVALSGTFEQVSGADFDWLLEVNLHAVVRMTRAFLPQLLSRPGSHVVNISSLFGLIAPPGQVAYATSKYAVRGFTEALRHEVADRGVGVTVVHPGGIRTNIAANARLSRPDMPAEERARLRAWADAALTMPPEEAARIIVAAVRDRRPRVVITRLAKVADLLARLTPAHYWAVSRRLNREAQ